MGNNSIRTDLAVDLNMPHLADLGAAQEKAEAALEPKKAIVNTADPKLEKVYTFEFKHTDGRGKIWAGTFENHILSIKENQTAGLMQAQLQQGLPYESVDPLTRELNYILSHLAVSLSKTVRPEWATDLQALTDIRLLQALYSEVAKHEATFLGA